ncbi:hypothetical protein D3C76_1537920 [compost metagenome]
MGPLHEQIIPFMNIQQDIVEIPAHQEGFAAQAAHCPVIDGDLVQVEEIPQCFPPACLRAVAFRIIGNSGVTGQVNHRLCPCAGGRQTFNGKGVNFG